MIKLIKEDVDSFARREKMYYKKRPELMKLVEELYRAGCDDSATNSPYDTNPQNPDSRTTQNPYFEPDEQR
ncbi:putative protein Networked (NET), actin-binding (NAB) [Helianthus anomalus]